MFSRVRKITRIHPCQKISYSFSIFIFSISAFAVLLVLPCFGLTLKELETSYESKCSEIRLEKTTALESLRESYLGALRRIEAKYQRAGRLDEVLLVKHEAAAIEKAQWPLKSLPKAISLETSAPRKIYLKKHIEIEQQAAKDLAGTADTMEKALDHQVADLTKSGDLAEAKLAQQIKAEIAKDPHITSARQLLKNVRTDGSSRPALRIRRAGDNIEVLVHYDMRGKIGPESPVSNVEESDKSIGDTEAKNLGEFVGTEGYEVDPYVAMEKVFDKGELGDLTLTEVDSKLTTQYGESSGLALTLKEAAINPYISVPVTMTPTSTGGTTSITVRYFIPQSNKGITAFKFIQGLAGGSPFGGQMFDKTGKWEAQTIVSEPTSEESRLLLYLIRDATMKNTDLSGEPVVLGEIKIEQIAFTSYIVQRLGENRVVTEEFVNPEEQPKLTANGVLVP